MEEIEKLKQENEILRRKLREIKEIRANKQKNGMIEKASQGFPMSRPPFGYKFLDGKLILAENFKEVEELLMEKLNYRQVIPKLYVELGYNYSLQKKQKNTIKISCQ